MSGTSDVIVVGLGGIGSAAAYHLARRGQRVLGLDRFTAAHDRGSSHGNSRLIRQAYFEDPAYVPLVLRAYELWREAEEAAGSELLLISGLVIIGSAGSGVVAGSLRSAEQWRLDHEVLDSSDIARRFPTFAPGADATGVYEPRAGVLRPEAAVAAHLRLAADAGAELHFSTPVLNWEADADGRGVTVTTGSGTFRAGRLVVCPGPWAPDLLEDLGVPLEIERHVQFWFQPDFGLDAFLPDRHPAWLWDGGAGDGLPYGLPAVDGPDGGAKVSWHGRGRPCHPDAVDRTVTPSEVADIAATIRDRVPAMAGRFLRAVPCMYTNTPDGHFLVGPHPRHPQVVVAAGFCGHGFKFAPVMGEIVADLTVDGTTAHPIALFDPGRFS